MTPGILVPKQQRLGAGAWPPMDTELTTVTSVMPEDLANSQRSLFRRTIELWPYLFVAISVTGLAYVALTAAR
jgi:hypothetical protein